MSQLLQAILLAIVGAIGTAHADTGAQTLHHRFTIADIGTWTRVSIELSPPAWRAGSPDGPVASEAQLRKVLGRLDEIVIGGRCSGAGDATTYYPCSFGIAEPDLGGIVAERFDGTATEWVGTAQATVLRPNALRPGRGSVEAFSAPIAARDGTGAQFLGLVAPARYLGDQRASYGARLTFSFRAVDNDAVRSKFDLASGSVVLRSGTAAALVAAPAAGKADTAPATVYRH